MGRAIAVTQRWGWRLAVLPAVAVVAVAVLVLTGASSSSATYRTATVTTGDVTQTLTTTGSIESASRYDLGFQVGGTVADVTVGVGDTVEAGDVLATLDTGDLDDAVAEAEQALADAEEALADDLAAQSDASSSSSTSSASYPSDEAASTATFTAAVSTGAGSTVAAAAEDTAATADAVEQAREALIEAQQALIEQYDAAQLLLVAAQDAAEQAQLVCAVFTGTDDDSESEGDGSVGAEASGTSGEGDGELTADELAEALADCQQATEDALAASQASIEAQALLMERASDVDEAVAALQQAISDSSADTGGSGAGGSDPAEGSDAGEGEDAGAGTSGGGSVPESSGDAGVGTGDEGSSGEEAAGGGSSALGGATTTTSTVPSAADILADKAEITAAEAALAVAQQQLEYTTLVAPVAGEIIAVAVSPDQTVSAGDTSAVITLIADNAYLVQLSVSLTQAQLLEVGQEAELTLTSSGEVVNGAVSSVSTVNTGNSFSQAYAVTVAVPDPGFEIRIGAATRMQITVAGASGVLVVPTSAIVDAAGDATVQVIGDDGVATSASIVTGAIGAVYTEVVSGLEEGDEVVLADLTLDVTADDDETESSGGLLSGLSEDESESEFQAPEGFAPGGGQMPGGFQGGTAG